MSVDIYIHAEIKENGIWKPLLKEGCTEIDYLHENLWESKLSATTIIPEIFFNRIVCNTWYDHSKVIHIYKDTNGEPQDISDFFRNDFDERIDGYVTSSDIENYDWNIEIPYIRKDLMDLNKNFKEAFDYFFDEIEYLKTKGEDYRLVCYFG